MLPRCSYLAIIAAIVPVLTLAVRGQNPAIAHDEGEVGVPWTGQAGITQTVKEIMARVPSASPEQTPRFVFEGPDRSHLPLAPDSLGPVASWPPQDQGRDDVPRGTNAESPSPQSVGTSFTAITLSESGGFIPPDTAGDVSPTQILVATNGRIRVFGKAGLLGALNTTLNALFDPVRNGSTTNGPIIRYDRLTDRWFVMAYTTSFPNRILIAVSSTGAITGTSSFTLYFFQQDLVGTTPNVDTGRAATLCSMGVDANALYIGGDIASSSGAYFGCTGWVVRKSSVTSGGPIVVTAFRQIGTLSSGPYSPLGVNNDSPSATEGYFIAADVAITGRLVVRRISNPGTTPAISANINIAVASTAIPLSVPALGSVLPLSARDDSLLAAHIRRNRRTGLSTLWTSHGIKINSSGTGTGAGDRVGMRWYELQNLTTTPNVRQLGTLFDTATDTPRSYWMGSCTMSGQGHMATGASFAATDEYAGCAAAGRLADDVLGSIQPPTDIIAGVQAYNIGGAVSQRWGDYSHTVVDPADDMTMWTFQEFTSAINSWGVRVAKLVAPGPATPISCSPSEITQGTSNFTIALTGTSTNGTGFFDPDPDFLGHISATIGGGGVTVNNVIWADETHIAINLTVAANAAPGPRTTTVTNPDRQFATSAAGILTILPSCAADVDDGSGTGTPGGGVDINDLLFFLASFESGSITFADLDNGSGTGTPDGGVDINDLLFFLTHFEAGC